MQVGSGQRSAELTAHEALGCCEQRPAGGAAWAPGSCDLPAGDVIVVLICSCSMRRHRASSREMAANPENIDTIVSLMSLKAF